MRKEQISLMSIVLLLSTTLGSCSGDSCWEEYGYSWELNAVGGCDMSSVFAVGDMIVRSTTSGWSSKHFPYNALFYDVWCASHSNAYAVSGRGEIWHYNGREWGLQAEIEGVSEAAALLGVWGSNEGQVFVVGRMDDAGIVLRKEGSDWNGIHQVPQESFTSIWGSSNTDVYVAGKNHVIHYDGLEWSEVSIDDEGTFWDVSGVSNEEIYILSNNNIWMIDAIGTSLLRENIKLSVSDLHAPRTGVLYAVGKDYSRGRNQVLRYSDGEWKDLRGGISSGIELNGIWASQDGKVVVVGNEHNGVNLQGVLLEYKCN